MNLYWKKLEDKSKRLALLWLYILKTEPIEEIKNSFLESKFIDSDKEIKPHLIPRVYYMMSANQLLREIDKTGGHPSWIQN